MSKSKFIKLSTPKEPVSIKIDPENPFLRIILMFIEGENEHTFNDVYVHCKYNEDGNTFTEQIQSKFPSQRRSELNIELNKQGCTEYKFEFGCDKEVEESFELTIEYETLNYLEHSITKLTFIEHISDLRNSKILFSAPFGTGKSTFLKYFFEENKEKFNVFHLYPLHYSVAENQDIFKYIKVDLLIQLLNDNRIDLDTLDYSSILTVQHYFLSNTGNIVGGLLSLGMELDERTSWLPKAIDRLVKIIKGWEKYHSDVNKSEFDVAKKYIEELANKEGSIYESDVYTQLVRSLVQQLSDKSQKKSVLIIDDLDRMDPDHIFRILNVISAHYDEQLYSEAGLANKFGFDKIILVCDLQNIKGIYEHRFGKSADFGGYISKFFSSGLYTFNSKEVVLQMIEQMKFDMRADSRKKSLDLLMIMSEHQLISLRDLIKIKHGLSNQKSLSKKIRFIKSRNEVGYWFSSEPHFELLLVLSDYFPKGYILSENLKPSSQNLNLDSRLDWNFRVLCAAQRSELGTYDDEFEILFKAKVLNFKVKSVISDVDFDIADDIIKSERGNKGSLSMSDFWELLDLRINSIRNILEK